MKCISVEKLCEAAKTPEKLISEGEKAYTDQLEAAARKIFAQRGFLL